MDPYHSQRNQFGPRSDTTEDHQAPGHPDRNTPAAADRQPRHSDGFTMIPPDESRRSTMKMMAQKEEEDMQRWKETHRVTSVHVNPERLGGHVTQAEARTKQFTDLRCSKMQKKLKQQELDKRRRQEEEEKLQKMKDEQRKKAERLEEKSRQEEQRRSEELRQHRLRTNEAFLQSFERRTQSPLASSSAACTSSRGETAERNQREESVGEAPLEHKRVNAAFLDKLESRSRQSELPGPAPKGALTHLKLDPDQSCSGQTDKADAEPDCDWALMKLMASFPVCNKVFLEDILHQFNGDYEQAYNLLLCSLT